jgi:hypothetical protein
VAGNVVDDLTDWLRTNANMPESTVEIVLGPVEQILDNQNSGLLSIGALLALWGAKNAIGAVIKGLNVAYGVKDTRPWWQVWGIAIGLTFGLGLAAATVSIVLIAGTEIGKQIAAWLNLSAWDTVWNWLRVPLIVFMLAVLLSFFYWAGPDRRAPYRFLTVGSVLTVVLWGVASWVLFGGQLNAILEAQWAGATPEEAAEATQVDYGATRAPREQPLTPAPAPATASIQDEIRGWETRLPSAEAAARQAMANPSGLDRWYRRLQVTRLLVASAIAGVAAAIIGTRGRS